MSPLILPIRLVQLAVVGQYLCHRLLDRFVQTSANAPEAWAHSSIAHHVAFHFIISQHSAEMMFADCWKEFAIIAHTERSVDSSISRKLYDLVSEMFVGL